MIHFLQGKFIRIHFGPSGKLASADVEICELMSLFFNTMYFSFCFISKRKTSHLSLCFRSSGKIQSDISAAWWEELPHLLPDHVPEETRAVGWVKLAAFFFIFYSFLLQDCDIILLTHCELFVLDMLLVTSNPYDFHFCSQGVTTVENMDDGLELMATDVKTFIFFHKERKSAASEHRA